MKTQQLKYQIQYLSPDGDGYFTLRATCAKEAEQIFQFAHPDAIVLDVLPLDEPEL
jgi:hypothetical protein